MEATSRQKRALLIGVNEYPNLSSFAQLEGCVNDVRLMAGLLRDVYGFAEDDVIVLENAAATRDGILAALEALADETDEGDIVVLHYAGHGSQMTCREGDEPDGMDETIVPYDAGRAPFPNRDITDDELHEWLLRVTEKTSYVTLLFDCCHSGSIARDAFGAKARYLEPDTRPVEELLPSPIAGKTRSASTTETGPSGWLPLSKRYVLIAGCRDDESSYEYRDTESNTPHGALTFFLGRELSQATPGTTYRDVYERVRTPVTTNSSKQHPQMEGALDRELFGTRDIEPMRFAAVESREGKSVTLAAGAAHGLTAGSEWAVYPSGTKKTEGVEPLGRVRITRVGAVSSEADLVEETEDGAIAVGTRGVEASHEWGDLALRVAIRADDDASAGGAERALAEAIEASDLLTRVGDDEPADVCARLVPARSAAADGDPAPQLGAVDTPTWAVVGADGRFVMPAHAASKPGVAKLLRENLEKIARYRHALALANPATDSVLRGKIDVQLQRLDGGDKWITAEPEEAGGEIVFEAGERIAFTVTNNHDEPVFVHALDFGLTGKISLLTIAGANEALAAGGSQSVGIRRPLVLSFPQNFPFVQEPGESAPVEGTETLKIFATTHPTDFSSLLQEGVRSVGGGSRSPLSRLLRKAFQGERTREMGFADEEPEEGEDWTTITRTFVLRRTDTGVALKAEGEAVDLGTITIRSRGLDGRARVLPTPTFSARTRSVERTTDDLDAVLDREHVGTQRTIEIQEVRTRSLTAAEPEIELDVPDPGEDHGQFLLYTDESGVTTWQFAEGTSAGQASEGGAQRTRSADGRGTQTYIIRRAAPVPTGDVATRGLIGAVGSKLIKLLVFPLIDPIIGKISDTFADRWEGKNRPYGLRPFTPDDYRAPETPALGGDDWKRLGAGRSLLFVHGTFSRANSAFGGLSPEAVADLHRQYDGRVFAFDHFTLSHDPKENIAWLLQNLPDNAALDLDIVCHSRGGLVSRMLAEQQSAFSLGSRSVKVGKVVFVASPNAGTHLADPEHMGDLVDTYTNLLNFIPDNPVTDVLEGVITVAKQLAVGALGGLDGLRSMRPGGDFQQWLNAEGARGDTAYYALGADFSPAEPGFKKWALERLTDSIFGAENDLVVPTASVYDANGSSYFPIEERHVFPSSAGISHTTFFQHRDAQEKMLSWLHA